MSDDKSPQRQIKRPRKEGTSSPIEINTKSDDRQIPGFVAGASPAKFITANQLKEINNELEKMSLAHEIALDPDFSVEQLQERTSNDLTKKVEEIATKAFYDSIRSKLNEDPPNYEPIFNLYAELKPMAIETVTPQASRIFDQVDVDEPRKQRSKNCLDMRGLLLEFLNLLAKVCAPIRDDEIKRLRDEDDVVDMFRGMHDLLKGMKNDMLNFSIRQSRHQFLEHAAKFECEKFMKVLELYPNAADETQLWLNEAFDEYSKTRTSTANEINQAELPLILSIAYARLLEGKRDDITFPETLKYDMGRVSTLVNERIRLSLTLCGVFMASNLAGKDVCEKTDFKQRLKSNLIAILNDVNKQNYESHLENIYLECNKQLEESLKTAWTSNYSALLKSQIDALKNSDNSIRKIVNDRIFTVVSTVLRGPQAMSNEGIKLPAGIGLIESEIVSLISRYLTITIHNLQSFGALYLQRLNRINNTAQSTVN